jgi:serine/threonine protein kinase
MLFGKYCLLERLSVGGMAEVFRAKPLNSPSTDRFLALKRILPHLAEDEEFIKMFVDEAKLCVHLRHPNIVHIFELGKFQSSSYILMEYIPGQDLLALQKRLRQRRLIMSVAQACYVVMELAKGLDYAHKATDDYGRPLNIIHRDVSPQNVLISYGGQVKLIDFGVAKAAVQSTKTQVGVLKGKFGYMSPEQIRGEAIDQRSDIFAAGTVLWELLTNRRLFTGDNEFEIFQKVRDANVDPPSAKNPQIPPEVDRIVMKALTAHPEQRYSYCADLARDLGQFLTSIEPLYTQRHLSDWMARFFEEEFASEQQ